jgi:hypothetical protein
MESKATINWGVNYMKAQWLMVTIALTLLGCVDNKQPNFASPTLPTKKSIPIEAYNWSYPAVFLGKWEYRQSKDNINLGDTVVMVDDSWVRDENWIPICKEIITDRFDEPILYIRNSDWTYTVLWLE